MNPHEHIVSYIQVTFTNKIVLQKEFLYFLGNIRYDIESAFLTFHTQVSTEDKVFKTLSTFFPYYSCLNRGAQAITLFYWWKPKLLQLLNKPWNSSIILGSPANNTIRWHFSTFTWIYVKNENKNAK